MFLAAFLIVGALLGLEKFFERGVSDLRDYFSGLRYALVLLAPATTMRLFAEERRAGTLELLFTLPVRPHEAVLAKFLAAVSLTGVGLVAGLLLPCTLAPFADFDLGHLVSGYLGALLLASSFLGIGLLCSSLSRSQEVSFLTAAGACLLLNLAGDARVLERLSLIHI